MGKLIALEIGTCDVLSMERSAQGITVNADLYDINRKLIARIQNNALHALEGQNLSVDRNGDLSTFIVRNGNGDELLYVRYLNPTTIRARGVFGCPGHDLVTVTDEAILPGAYMSDSCFANNYAGIKIQ